MSIMTTTANRFSIPDYVVFAISLLASLAIGVYSAFSGRKEKTIKDFYFGNHDMNLVAVAMSLAATFLSAIGILGVPSEVYHNGISYVLLLIGEFVCSTTAMWLIIPFFYNLKLTSVYEYFEHRFNKVLRRCACLMFILNMLLYMSLVLYAPALALSQVSGLPIWASIITSGLICTIYTSLGGMKAVIFTDAFQMVVMLSGVITVLVHGIISAGGLANVWQSNRDTGRLDIIFTPDPTIRHSFWTLVFGGMFTILPFSLNQATVQRYLSVNSQRSAQKMVAIQMTTSIIWWSMLVFIGLTVFAYYQGCDPELANRIERPDQIMAIFVVDTLGYLQGLPGLFTAVVYSATLSTVSSGVNSIVVVLTEDFIKPLNNFRNKPLLDEKTVMLISKALSFFVGFLAIGLAFVASALGQGLTQFCFSIDGMCSGPLLGLFFCGMMLPYCNSKGATVGIFCGLATTFWIGTGAILAALPQHPLPANADACPAKWINNNSQYMDLFTPTTFNDHEGFFTTDSSQTISETSTLNKIYGLSYQLYSVVGFVVTVVVASIVSLLTGRQDSSKIPDRFFLYKRFTGSKSLHSSDQDKESKERKTQEYSMIAVTD